MVDRRPIGWTALCFVVMGCSTTPSRDAALDTSDATSSSGMDALDEPAALDAADDLLPRVDATDADAAVDDATRDASDRDGPLDVVTDSPTRCESERELCEVFGFECGPVPVTDSCGVARMIHCGACATGYCGGSGAIGQCSTMSIPSQTAVPGAPTRVYPSRFGAPAQAIEAVSPDEMWMSVDARAPIYRWRRGRPLDTVGMLTVDSGPNGGTFAFAVGGPDAVFAATPGVPSFARFDGTVFRPLPLWPASPRLAGNRVVLAPGGDDFWVGACSSDGIQHWDGTSWTAFALDSDACTQRIWREPSGAVLALVGPNRTQLLRFAPGAASPTVDPSVTDVGLIDFVRTTDGEYASTMSALLYRPRPSAAWSTVIARAARRGTLRTFGADVWASFGNGAIVARGGVVRSAIASDGLVAPVSADRAFVRRSAAIYDVRANSPLAAPVVGLFLPHEICADVRPRDASLAYGLCNAAGRQWLTRIADAEGWSWLSETASPDSRAFWMNRTSSVWSGSISGAIEQRDPASGSLVTSHNLLRGSTIQRIAGSSDRDVWALTTTGVLVRFDGASWQTITLSTPLSGTILDAIASPAGLWVLTATSIVRVAPDGLVTNVAQTPLVNARSIALAPDGRLWALTSLVDDWGCLGRVYEHNGLDWIEHPTDCTVRRGPLRSLDATPDGVFAIRGEGTSSNWTQRWTGTEWTPIVAFSGVGYVVFPEMIPRVLDENDLWIGPHRLRR